MRSLALAQGHVVTNYHVISGGVTGGALPKSVRVKTQGMLQGVEAAVVGVEPDKEIALTSTRTQTKKTPFFSLSLNVAPPLLPHVQNLIQPGHFPTLTPTRNPHPNPHPNSHPQPLP